MSELQYTDVKAIPGIVDDLRKTFTSGITKDQEFRKSQLRAMIRFMEEKKDVLLEALWKDLRKHATESHTGELSCVIDEAKYMIKNMSRLCRPVKTKKRFMMNAMDKTIIRREAKGVVLVIGQFAINACGGCHCSWQLLLPQYLDKRAYAFVNGGVEETTVVLEQKFDHIFYTGNGVVGKIVMKAASNFLTPVTLELGGKSPCIVAPDADFDVTANRLVWGKFFNNGQTCVAPDYVLVTKDDQEKLINALRKTLLNFYTANPKTSGDYGRIVNTRQFDRLVGLLGHYDETQVAIGGKHDRDELFIEPTILKSISYKDEHIMQQEIFGPILPIVPVDSMEQAIKIINTRDHPLALYVFSDKSATYQNILDKTQSGGVAVNECLLQLQELSIPFGGVGGSGMGNYHGEKSFTTFIHERGTMIKSSKFESLQAVRYPPYTDDKQALLSMLVYDLPASAGAKVKAVLNACSAAWRVFFRRPSKL
ncbi:aldehyde dehydrogenase [Hesseltinella vesiculosa]|uniref:Aldehyde dehydrogenase n=1 Tax=Hesseltinella vesiculosa TaxID=101127 RepID=A0A1X2GX29_9FUNG|nr:aldehyde dehydrogenase [Hesseltinella vesiculosa]